PQYPRPPEFASDSELLVHLARQGSRERFGDPLPPEVAQRLDYELDVINRTGYAGYFLIVYDLVKAARDRGIPVGPGRGSAAGSLVAYALGITKIDPLRFDLLFERFLNPRSEERRVGKVCKSRVGAICEGYEDERCSCLIWSEVE